MGVSFISKFDINSLNKFYSTIWKQTFCSRSSNNVSRLNLGAFFATIGYIGFDPYPRTPKSYCQMNRWRLSLSVIRRTKERRQMGHINLFPLKYLYRESCYCHFSVERNASEILFLFLLSGICFTCFTGI